MEEVLNERKQKILKAIIKTYMETGEPVGSRTLSKYTDLNLSSATIRNEMADLEDLGYIFQPHTSAGRIPSDKGYRLYVDMLMEEKEQEIRTLQADITNLKYALSGLQSSDDSLDGVADVLAPLRDSVAAVIKGSPSLQQAVELISTLYSDRIFFLESAKVSAKESSTAL